MKKAFWTERPSAVVCVLAFNWCGQHFPCRDISCGHTKFCVGNFSWPRQDNLIFLSYYYFQGLLLLSSFYLLLASKLCLLWLVRTKGFQRHLVNELFDFLFFPFVVVAVPKTTWKVYEMLLSFVGKMCHRRPFFGAVKYKTFVLISCGQRYKHNKCRRDKNKLGPEFERVDSPFCLVVFFFLWGGGTCFVVYLGLLEQIADDGACRTRYNNNNNAVGRERKWGEVAPCCTGCC